MLFIFCAVACARIHRCPHSLFTQYLSCPGRPPIVPFEPASLPLPHPLKPAMLPFRSVITNLPLPFASEIALLPPPAPPPLSGNGSLRIQSNAHVPLPFPRTCHVSFADLLVGYHARKGTPSAFPPSRMQIPSFIPRKASSQFVLPSDLRSSDPDALTQPLLLILHPRAKGNSFSPEVLPHAPTFPFL